MAEICASVLIKSKQGAESCEELESLFREFVNGVQQKDTGVPGYSYFRGEDGSYRVLERYESSEAYLRHLEKMDDSLVERLVQLADFPEVEILGDPSEEVRQRLAGFEPRYRKLVTGL